jgi:hypothetical protein
MVNLTLQKRLAASVLGCGLHRVWLDPNEVNDLAAANSRKLFQHPLNNFTCLFHQIALPTPFLFWTLTLFTPCSKSLNIYH